jgi:phage gpG-like protein
MAANASESVRVEGLRELMKAFKNAAVDAEDQKDLMHQLGSIVGNAARPPEDSGLLASTIRAGRGKTKAVVRAGGARAPYAGVIHYGWPGHNIEPQPFLLTALQSTSTQVVSALNDGVGKLLRDNKIK